MFAVSIAILLSAAASSSSYPGFEALTTVDDQGLLCTDDGEICIYNGLEPGVLTITRGDREIANWSPDNEDGNLSFEPMPALIRLADGRLLVGALATHHTSYSGGGGSATDQVLALVEPGKAIKNVLTVPEGGNLAIRACFSERDYKHRAGACDAEFRFSGTLTVVRSTAARLPTLSFRLEASHFPRGASRYDDSTTGSALHKGDLKWEEDTRCTFERSFHFDAALGKYQPDAALPDCSEYTEP